MNTFLLFIIIIIIIIIVIIINTFFKIDISLFTD